MPSGVHSLPFPPLPPDEDPLGRLTRIKAWPCGEHDLCSCAANAQQISISHSFNSAGIVLLRAHLCTAVAAEG